MWSRLFAANTEGATPGAPIQQPVPCSARGVQNEDFDRTKKYLTSYPGQHTSTVHVVEASQNNTAIWALSLFLLTFFLGTVWPTPQVMIFMERFEKGRRMGCEERRGVLLSDAKDSDQQNLIETAQYKPMIESLEGIVDETEKRKCCSEFERQKALLETETNILKLNVSSLEMRAKVEHHKIIELERKQALLETEIETLRATSTSLEMKAIEDQRNTAEFILKLVLERETTGTTNVTTLQNYWASLSEATRIIGNATGTSSTEQLYRATLEELLAKNAKEKSSDEIGKKPWKTKQVVVLVLLTAAVLLWWFWLIAADPDVWEFSKLLLGAAFVPSFLCFFALARVMEWVV